MTQTVQKSQGQPPFGCLANPFKQWDKLPTSTGARRISEPSTVSSKHAKKKLSLTSRSQKKHTSNTMIRAIPTGWTSPRIGTTWLSEKISLSTDWEITLNSLASPSQRSHVDSLGSFFLPTRIQAVLTFSFSFSASLKKYPSPLPRICVFWFFTPRFGQHFKSILWAHPFPWLPTQVQTQLVWVQRCEQSKPGPLGFH